MLFCSVYPILTLIGHGFFTCLGFLGEGGGHPTPPITFVVCGPITTKFCTGIDSQSVNSNMKKLHKINDIMDSDVIILRNLAKNTVKRGYFKIADASSFFIQPH